MSQRGARGVVGLTIKRHVPCLGVHKTPAVLCAWRNEGRFRTFSEILGAFHSMKISREDASIFRQEDTLSQNFQDFPMNGSY